MFLCFMMYYIKKIDQIINRQQATNCLSVFDRFVGLTLNPFVQGVEKGCIGNEWTKKIEFLQKMSMM